VIVAKVRTKGPPQVRLVQDDHVIQALSPYRPDHTLHVRRLPKRSRCDHHLINPHGADATDEVVPVDPISIPDHETRRRVRRECLDDLLARPE
jgi:hypothetical protein